MTKHQNLKPHLLPALGKKPKNTLKRWVHSLVLRGKQKIGWLHIWTVMK